jgi:pyridinium-3,5-bisthiocarboxylic acid mononucleotide nickel chelatase
MRILILDPFHGAAGDMIIGALLGCGADRDLVIRAMKSVAGTPKISTVTRRGIRGIAVKTRAAKTHRTLSEVLARCEQADAPREALAMARRVFGRIGSAEKTVHGKQAHFHEVGADDAVADVVGACTALGSLEIDGVAVLPVTLGRGTVRGAHGTYPVPAPATVGILAGTGISAKAGEEEGELCTPTGAALLAEFATLQEPDIGQYKILAVGYGAGSRDSPGAPNMLRAMIVKTTAPAMNGDSVDILETNVDDVSGEVIAHAITRFMDAGALDASVVPCTMKKGRPGYLVRVICTPETSAGLAELVARELGTLGIRCTPAVHRFVADRTTMDVEVTFDGHHRKMPVKCGWIRRRIYTIKPEFGPAREWAEEMDVPVRDVLQVVTEAAWQVIQDRGGTRDEK